MNTLRFLLILTCLLSLIQHVQAAGRAYEHETTREEILASRRRRAKQLESMLEDSKQRLSDHHAGTKLLSEKDKAALEKKINIYQRKLETLQGDLDDREVERIIKREKLRDERLKERRAQRQSRQDEL